MRIIKDEPDDQHAHLKELAAESGDGTSKDDSIEELRSKIKVFDN